MLFAINNRDELEKLNELVSLQNQVQEVRLQDVLGKQNFHDDMKKVFEPVSKSIKDVYEEVAKTLPETSKNDNKPLENLNNKLLEIMND